MPYLSAVCGPISIHALREEGDDVIAFPCGTLGDFYPRPPRGGRQDTRSIYRRHGAFLSTPSARRATLFTVIGQIKHWKISIHALREEGDLLLGVDNTGRTRNFYPRPPRGGRPACRPCRKGGEKIFLSTPSARRATCHASRLCCALLRFLSTPSARRATSGRGQRLHR